VSGEGRFQGVDELGIANCFAEMFTFMVMRPLRKFQSSMSDSSSRITTGRWKPSNRIFRRLNKLKGGKLTLAQDVASLIALKARNPFVLPITEWL